MNADHERDDLQREFDSLLPAAPASRRGFLVTGLGAGFALAVRPVMAQTAIHTDTAGLSAGPMTLPTYDGDLPAYRAQPEGGTKLPTVLVIPEIFGVHEYIADVCRRFAKRGYLAIAPEVFFRQGDPGKIASVQQILAEVISKVPDAQVMKDLDACTAWAAAHGGDPGRLAITGFCWGGRITWLYAAHNPALKAGVAWYGRLDGEINERTPRHPLDLAAELKAPVLGLYGGADQGIPVEDVEAMRQAIARAGGKSQLHVYPDTPHAFHADYRPSYRKEAAEDGWRRCLAWFEAHGV
jgi:carboxymethylenebutenolidase